MTATFDHERDALAANDGNAPIAAGTLRSETLHGDDVLAALADAARTRDGHAATHQLAPPLLASVADATGDEIRAVAVRRGRQIAFLWPFAILRRGPVAMAVRAGRAVQCYDDGHVAPRHEAASVLRMAWREIETWRGIDALHLPHIREDSALVDMPGVRERLRIAGEAPYLDLSAFATVDAYNASLSRNRRRSIRRNTKRLGEHGDVAFRDLVDPDDRQAAIRQALAFKRNWLEDQHAVSAGVGSDYFEPALLGAAASDACNDAMKVFALTVNDEVVAVEIGLVTGHAYHSHIGAFSPEWSKLGVGTLLTGEVIGWCIGKGLATYDMLAPDTPFKRDWTDVATPVFEATVPLTVAGHVAALATRHGRGAAKAFHAALPPPARSAVRALVQRLR